MRFYFREGIHSPAPPRTREKDDAEAGEEGGGKREERKFKEIDAQDRGRGDGDRFIARADEEASDEEGTQEIRRCWEPPEYQTRSCVLRALVMRELWVLRTSVGIRPRFDKYRFKKKHTIH